MFKKITIGVIVLILVFIHSPNISAEAEKEVVTKTIPELVDFYADAYNVSSTQMMAVMKCENNTLDTNLQSRLKYSRDNSRWGVVAGQREESYGLVQIHLPDHPHISKEQATNPEFAIEFMAQEFSKGRASKWTCYRKLY